MKGGKRERERECEKERYGEQAHVEAKAFFLSLPMALEREDVVVVHAAWDEEQQA